MNRQFSIIVAVLIIILAVIVYYSFKFINNRKGTLYKSEIIKITICKPQPICDISYRLTSKEVENFISKWNGGNSLGYDKLSCSYYLDVYLVNGKKRSFGIAQDEITENWGGGIIYSIGDKNYFDSLYTLLKARH